MSVSTAWIDGATARIGALKVLDPTGGEVRSMRAHPDPVCKGTGRALPQAGVPAAVTE